MTGDELEAAEFPASYWGYSRREVRRRLWQYADLWAKGFSAWQCTLEPGTGIQAGYGSGYDRKAVDRFFATLAGHAPPGLVALPEIRIEKPPKHRLLTAAERQYVRDANAAWGQFSGLPGSTCATRHPPTGGIAVTERSLT